jgi:hypothetical protein
MEIESVDNLYQRCSEKYLLARQKFCSIDDFQEAFLINGRKMVINLLNLTCVEESNIRPKELWEAIHKLDDDETIGNEFLKDLSEFSSLSFLLSIYPRFYFQKSERPDFVLKDTDTLIGLEVTSAMLGVEAKAHKVAKFTFGRNKSAKEIEEYVNAHPKLADKYGLYDVYGKAVLSPSQDLVDCHTYKNVILKTALRKSKKIRGYSSFSEFWVLIDTQGNVCFTEEHDAEELSKLFIREGISLVGIDKIIVTNVMNKVSMIYDVKSHQFRFTKQENA